MSGNSTNQSTTTYAPSQLDTVKGETLQQLRNILFPEMTPSLAGEMTADTAGGNQQNILGNVGKSASTGVGPGSETMLAGLTPGGGSNSNALKMALGLYGYAPNDQGNVSRTGSMTPSPASVGLAAGALGTSLYNLGKTGYNAYNNWQTGQDFEQSLPSTDQYDFMNQDPYGGVYSPDSPGEGFTEGINTATDIDWSSILDML